MNRAPKTGRLSSSDLSWLCGQVALVLKAGVPLDDGLRLMAEGVEPRSIPRSEGKAKRVVDRRTIF